MTQTSQVAMKFTLKIALHAAISLLALAPMAQTLTRNMCPSNNVTLLSASHNFYIGQRAGEYQSGSYNIIIGTRAGEGPGVRDCQIILKPLYIHRDESGGWSELAAYIGAWNFYGGKYPYASEIDKHCGYKPGTAEGAINRGMKDIQFLKEKK